MYDLHARKIRRCFVAGVFILLLLSLPTVAFGGASENDFIKITSDEAVEMAIKQSYERKKIHIATERLFHEKDDLKKLLDDAVSAEVQMRYTEITLEAQHQKIVTRLALLDPTDPADAMEMTALQRQLEQINNQISTISSAVTESEKSIKTVRDALETIEMSHEVTEETQELLTATLTGAVQKSFIALLSLELQVSNLELSVEELENLNNVEKIKGRLGLSSAMTKDFYLSNLLQLQASLENLRIQKDNAYTLFKNMIGFSPAQKVVLEDVGAELPALPDYEKGLKESISKGLGVTIGKNEVRRQKSYLENIQQRYKHDSSNVRKAKLDLKEAELKLEEKITETQANYRTVYNGTLQMKNILEQSISELEFTQRALNYAQVKFKVGTISRLELETEETKYKQKLLARWQAEYDYRRALVDLELVRKGVFQSQAY